MLESTNTTLADVPEGKSVIAVMSDVGDTKYLWDPKNPAEVKAAKVHFEDMREQGFLVFKLTPSLHRKGKEVKRFHPKGKGYLYVPPAEGADGKMVKDFDPEEEGRYIATPPIAGG